MPGITWRITSNSGKSPLGSSPQAEKLCAEAKLISPPTCRPVPRWSMVWLAAAAATTISPAATRSAFEAMKSAGKAASPCSISVLRSAASQRRSGLPKREPASAVTAGPVPRPALRPGGRVLIISAPSTRALAVKCSAQSVTRARLRNELPLPPSDISSTSGRLPGRLPLRLPPAHFTR